MSSFEFYLMQYQGLALFLWIHEFTSLFRTRGGEHIYIEHWMPRREWMGQETGRIFFCVLGLITRSEWTLQIRNETMEETRRSVATGQRGLRALSSHSRINVHLFHFGDQSSAVDQEYLVEMYNFGGYSLRSLRFSVVVPCGGGETCR